MIEVGEFVKLDNGKIGKVIAIEKGSIMLDIVSNRWIGICCIKKHSKNIIELLEVEDYVNGYKVLEVCPERGWIEVDCNKPSAETTIWENEIKTILTHEQYKQNAYEVEE